MVVTIALGLLRILFVLLVVRLLVRFVAAAVRGYIGPPAQKRETSVQLVRDGVCNTYVEKDRALSALVGGNLEYFCSVACRDRKVARAS